MSNDNNYVRVDEHGVLRVGNSRVMLDSIVAAFDEGHSAETIRQQYPALSLEQVYRSIAYYLAHAEEVHAYLQRQDAVWKDWQARAAKSPSPAAERLRALRHSRATEPT
jgi:uncharacterized protein (DUF433 family)